MFSILRSDRGQFTLLMAGLACLALSGIAGIGSLPAPVGLIATAGFGAAGIGCIALWWKRRRTDRYDLNRLWDAPAPSLDEPYEDTLPVGDEAAPYCGWCDSAYPAGTHRCAGCGRVLS